MTINLKVQTQNLREKGSSIKCLATHITDIHDDFIQITKELDYHVKQNVSYNIADCLHLLQDNYNLVGEYARQIMDAAEAYDRREEELHKMFEQLEIETLGIDVKGTHEIEKEQSKQPKAVMATLDRNFTKSPRDLYDDQDKEISKKETSREEIRKILEQIPELQEINYDMFLDNEQVKRIQEYIRSKGYKIMITSKLDSQTKFALVSMGIDISFLQEDSYRGDGLNLYAYVANNPVSYIEPTGYCKEDKDTYRSVDLTNGMNMYDPNSQLAQYIHDVQGVTYALTEPLIDSAYRNPTAGNLYPPMQFKPTVVELIYEELGFAVNNKKNEPAIKIALKVVKEAEDIYKSIQEGVSVGGPNAIAVGVTSVASYLYKKNPENIEPGYLQDYLFNIWSKSNRKSLIINVSKALYIKNTDFKYLINSVGARKKFIERLNTIRDSVDDFDLNGFDKTTQNNIRYLAKSAIDRKIEMNNNYSDSVKLLENKLNRIEQDIREKLQ